MSAVPDRDDPRLARDLFAEIGARWTYYRIAVHPRWGVISVIGFKTNLFSARHADLHISVA
jgi:hypothetical protein